MAENSSIWYLEEVNLFECFCPINHAEDRYDKQPKRSFKKGEFIYFSDDTSDKVFFIHEGAVKIAGYTEEGNEMIKRVLHTGEILENSLSMERRNETTTHKQSKILNCVFCIEKML